MVGIHPMEKEGCLVTAPTREVLNQSSDLVDYDLFTTNPALMDALAREGSASDHDRVAALGERLGTAEMFALGDAANRNPPVLRLFDRFGARRDEVEFHPAWHELMRCLVGEGLHTGPWSEPATAAHVTRAAGYMLWAEIENGTQCPATMTYGAVPTLARQPEDFGAWLQLLLARDYDPRFLPAPDKKGALMGMGMTEKQGGSDVRSNTTRAVAVTSGGPGREYRLTGHKWFFSAPMCDAFLVLAQAPGGLSCFFVPRFLPDRSVNTLLLQRLKAKLGNHSNASSEVVFEDTYGLLVGEEGRGIQTILEMGVYTRFDNAIGAAGLMRQCVSQAIHHARQRKAFGRLLIDQPLMRNVLADLALECESHIALVMRLARAFDAQQDEVESVLRRVLTPVAKYWVCKRAPGVIAEAMEVLGGNGYIEEGPIARRYREAPLNSIWEGSGNVICLDVLRAFAREPRTREVLEVVLAGAKGRDASYDLFVDGLLVELGNPADGEFRARQLTQNIALAVQAAILLGAGPERSAEAFLASRLAAGAPAAFGTLPVGVDSGAMIERILRF
jgi:putative acyl-CoA dehydrogenase